ncbi:alpha/beta hydrolase [Salisediminibacterium halotolerans]|uniref:Lysophospholipase n=1 Tax=Salisediminibacterium halotolerans TaxID=517425 RepID=A0A1H9UX73_9BACI|nr:MULTISPECIES: alpha/beta hydrolase [Salisediminibacterium]RLJ69430.1 lysophospholipase [Actinophytocola xinjiangensis]RPE83944.1 lysophospholipase [Salisediminibacterium halotolerans]TWG32505.1 lysophospholipase [Salisediminibacterium halotolerans]SES13931.1 lysophospholipase [Salisediminibacterium haloalkalitolerans]GEL07654.1 phospholipase [Salisediminibacterium halotolerans]
MWKWETGDEMPKGVFVLVHGAGEYHARYEWFINQLNQAGYHVVMGDLPGQGLTEGPRGHIEAFDQYTVQVSLWLEEARTYKLPVVLFGHSMGGLIAVRTMLRLASKQRPDLLLLSSPCFALFQAPGLPKKVLSKVLNPFLPKLMFPSNLEPGSGTRDEWMRRRDQNDDLLVKYVSVRWYRELAEAMDTVHAEISRMPNMPVFISQAGDDRIVDKTAVRKWFNELDIDTKYYKEWPGLYHEVLNEPEKHQVLMHMLGFTAMHLSRARYGGHVT